MKSLFLIEFLLLIVAVFSKTDLYVGDSSKPNNFNTVQEAVNKAASINPGSENDRVTIHISPGTYRQQVIVQTPFISFVNANPSKEVILTWYYGIGYKYYSVGSKNYYDANSAKQTGSKKTPSYRWGATVLLLPNAKHFQAQDITFENSFNRYMTNEEIKDGVELVGDTANSKITVVRKQGTDVRAKASKERSAALSTDTTNSEFKNCKFLSSQDTLYTGNGPHYFKNCHIEGNTDYIFGEASAVFDGCELCFYGYSDGTNPPVITAAKGGKNDDLGYLFMNCKVTANGSLKNTAGFLGRPWSQAAKVTYVNTVLSGNVIDPAGWTQMSGVQPESVQGFREGGTKNADGSKVDLSKRKGHTLSDGEINNINMNSYLKGWKPAYSG